VWAPSPGGTDDTAALQAALDRCVSHGPGCTVQLAAGRYLTRQLLAYGFRGTFRGRGRGVTQLEALPGLKVDSLASDTEDGLYEPPSAEHPWPSLLLFVDGDVRVSDLAIRFPHVPAAEPYELAPGFRIAALIDAIRFMGQRRTDAIVERVAVEGREDPDTGFWGFNVANAVTYAGELPTGSGIPFDYYPITGHLTVRSSHLQSVASGVYPTIVHGGKVTIGGSPGAGNLIENVSVGADLESLQGSVVDVSHNRVIGARWAAAWAIPWCCGYLPTKPSRFLIHDNHLVPTGTPADGIVLVDDPATPWIQAHVTRNTIEAQGIGYGAISAYNTRGSLVHGNRITGSGADAIGIWNGRGALVLRNDVEDFAANYTADFGHAQIVLDGSTSDSRVVCRTPADTVLDQGSGNRLIGCLPVAP
jgi:hypothetical protein